MHNELLLLLNLLLVYGMVLIFWRLWGTIGLIAWNCIAVILAYMEVLILIDAFSLEQTLGNILFASSFIVTDILSENTSKETAKKAVNLSIAASVVFIILPQIWLCYEPNQNDWAFSFFQGIFSNTPRVLLSGLIVFALVQRLDVWLYHKWWEFTKHISNSTTSFLWLRNNFATLLSQLVNAFLFNFLAFGGVYPLSSLISICLASYAVFFVMALLDTPVVYIARRWHKKYNIK